MDEYEAVHFQVTSTIEGQDIVEAEEICVSGPRDALFTLLRAGMLAIGGGYQMRNAETDEVLHQEMPERLDDNDIVI